MIRWAKWISLGLVIVIAVGSGSLWAHQVIAERLANSSYNTAFSSLSQDIKSARSGGLFPSELGPYTNGLAAVEARSAPADGTFWSAARESFYSVQTNRLRALDHQLLSRVSEATAQARSQTASLLSRYAAVLGTARANGLRLPTYAGKLNTLRSDFSRTRTVGQYRAMAGLIQPQVATVSRLVNERVAQVSSIVRQARSSSQPIQTIRAEINTWAATARDHLSMVALFAKDRGLSNWLDRVTNLALTRTHVKMAAIGAADVGRVGKAIRVRLAKVTPQKWILVSTENESMQWYQGSTEIGTSLVTTGNPQLPTVLGHFKIFAKFSPFTFISADPPGSPDWYAPSPVSYAMEFQSAGYFIHDAPWRSVYGPGSNGPGQPGTNYGGTHGCVNVPYDVAAELYAWAPIGTTVVVV